MKIVLSAAAVAVALWAGATPASAQVVYTYGSGAKLFTLDNLPTGPSGTQAFYAPDQNNSSLGLPNLPGNQGVLTQTVTGTTLSLSTPTFFADGSNGPATGIRVENDSTNFPYLGVPAGVQVGIEASTGSGGQPAPVFVNFSDALSYFSVNLYRLNSGAGPGSPLPVMSTVTAYSGLNGTGSVLGTALGSITGGLNFGYTIIQLPNLVGARSFTLQGANGLPNYDDITATLFVAPAAVPEPATWAMMLGGFGLAGAVMRRRTRRTVTFA
ncbi:PEPxxWA-CTERM sorting domain-containing protein [Sphingomonas bacterium]|uniref:PEPxxWA-CTERM sorting domain-containing protein n=1 Tax=Sphingomonas bacterium TaxID=1895847 RepID=UPI001575096A|nr:PEPxxWA-CTERM sorting domain-containing protein [Sphingomonas bacterium]